MFDPDAVFPPQVAFGEALTGSARDGKNAGIGAPADRPPAP